MSNARQLPMPADEPLDRQTLFVSLLNRHHRHLLGFIASLVGHRQDAEDVLQRASVTLWQKFDTFEQGTDFMAWAGRVAFYEAKNFLRVASHCRVQFDDALLELLAGERAVDLAHQDSRIEALDHCLAKLDEPSRELMRSAYLDDLNMVDLAAQLRRAPQTLYNKLNLIRRALAACVEQRLTEADCT